MHHPLLFTVIVLAMFLAALAYTLACAWASASPADGPIDGAPSGPEPLVGSDRAAALLCDSTDRALQVPIALGGRIRSPL